jgi:hypothetical protein
MQLTIAAYILYYYNLLPYFFSFFELLKLTDQGQSEASPSLAYYCYALSVLSFRFCTKFIIYV